MAEAQITLHEAWHFRPLLSLVESQKDCFSQFVSRSREILERLLARQFSARDIEKTIYVDRHGPMEKATDQFRPCFTPCQHPMKRVMVLAPAPIKQWRPCPRCL